MNIATAILIGLTVGSLFVSGRFFTLAWIDYIDNVLLQKTNIPIHHLKLLEYLIFSYPLADILRNIPIRMSFVRNIFSIISISLIFLVVIFDLWYGVQTVLISTTCAYIIVQYVKGPYMPYVAFVFLIGHLSINSHFYRQYLNTDERVDVTCVHMVLCIKLSAFAWNIYDGQQEESVRSQKEYALKRLPSLLDFLGYVFFFPSFFVGPSFDLVDYHRWLTNGVAVSVSKENNPDEFQKRLIWKDRYYSMKKLFSGLFYLYAFQWMSLHYSTTFVYQDNFFQMTHIRRFLYLYLLAFTHRLKYYGIWKLAEGACVLSGLGNSIRDSDGNITQYFFENINLYEFETAQSTKQLLDSWNKGTNRWLKYYVYLRIASHNKKRNIVGSIVTFMTSALWHGFYPGYYLSFMTGAFAQILGRYLRKYVRPLFLTQNMQPTRYKIVYDILSWFTTQITWAYIVQPFVLLNLRDSFLNDQQYYEAHQLMRTIINRHVKAREYNKAVDLLYSSSKSFLEVKQFASGGDLALYMIKLYDTMKLSPNTASKARVVDLLRLFCPDEPTRKRLIHDSLIWSGKYGNTAIGDPELHYEIGKILAHEGNLFAAEKHLVLGTPDGFGLFMRLLCRYFDQDALDMACFYTSRAVFPYLIIHNIACAFRAYNTMARNLSDKRNVPTLVLSSSSADIILFPSIPLMNFLCFLILTCQRTSSDLFSTLKAHYEDALKQVSSWKSSLDKIASIYFDIHTGRPPNNTWATLMHQLFGNDIALPNTYNTSSRTSQRLPSNTHETGHETLD
ncbi:hypothetical protein PMAC_001568 [Pneumocystis sp. 'macacae']|nr:hypothetical protein PMAC_001568 [Pneumocystis sp. 'macacae']